MDPIKLIIVFVVFVISTILFFKAAGTLKLTKLNMISTIFYYMIAFNYLGGSLVYLGFRKHYLIQKVSYESTIDQTFYLICYCMIVFPLILWFSKLIAQRLFSRRSFFEYVEEPVFHNNNMVSLQWLIIILSIIALLSTLYVFANLGYIPIIEMFKGTNTDYLRQSGTRFFSGNQYVKNLLMHTMTPFISYFAFIYYRITHSKVWRIINVFLFLLSIIVLTYDFSKSPIITYIIGFYLIEVLMGRVFNKKAIFRVVVASTAIILFFYIVVLRAGDQLFSIYSGPLGRILFTQIATLFLHIQVFPDIHPYLSGASFNDKLSFLFPNAESLRSGRVVMEIYNPSGIETNTAGVMNTLFVGEAYANFGYLGAIIAPIIFGIVIGLVAYFLPSLKKRPTTMLIYVQLTLQFITIIEGGFVDLFYSASILFVIILTIVLDYTAGYYKKKQIEIRE